MKEREGNGGGKGSNCCIYTKVDGREEKIGGWKRREDRWMEEKRR